MTEILSPGTITTISYHNTYFDNLVPLLTTFTPAASCETDWVYDIQTSGTVWKDRDYNADYALFCQPFNGANTVYRPGICPSGQEFKSFDITAESSGPRWYMGYCCSSAYKLSHRNGELAVLACASGLTAPIVATVTDETITNEMATFPTTTIASNVVGIMEPINIVWNENDLTYFPESVANSFRRFMSLTPLPTLTNSGPSILPPIPASTSATDDLGEDDPYTETLSSALSGGAKAGIGIGIVAFVVLLVSIFYLGCIRRRRKMRYGRRPETMENTSSNKDSLLEKCDRVSWLFPWRGRRTLSIEKGPGELHGQDTQEIDGRQAGIAELQDTYMGGRGNPVSHAQWHTELQGTTLVTQSHMLAELESEPLKSPS
ncbi:hypothetical protein F4805DRAFT_234937 [Annulohypoxylon moriforme]|nr:hypothetical protein F4805DRAFT_234937 [Annulohypoxylon moriforme]